MDIERLIVEMHNDLSTKVDEGFAKIGEGMKAHEVLDIQRFSDVTLKLLPLEQNRQMLMWVIRTLTGAVLLGIVAMVIDLAKNHLR